MTGIARFLSLGVKMPSGGCADWKLEGVPTTRKLGVTVASWAFVSLSFVSAMTDSANGIAHSGTNMNVDDLSTIAASGRGVEK